LFTLGQLESVVAVGVFLTMEPLLTPTQTKTEQSPSKTTMCRKTLQSQVRGLYLISFAVDQEETMSTHGACPLAEEAFRRSLHPGEVC